jgi:hypothetical protein
LGYWGSFWDTSATQTGSTSTGTAITLNHTDPSSSGVSIVSGSRITFATTGVYNIQYSIQFVNTDTGIHNVNVWLRRNDSGSTGDIADSNSLYAVVGSHGGTHGQLIAAVNYVVTVTAGDYFQIMWLPDDATHLYIETIASTVTPTVPETPGVIVTAVQVMNNQIGPTGPTGPTGPSGASTITVGSSTIVSGNSGRVVYDNAGVVGEYPISGTGTVAMTNSPTLVTPNVGVATATSVNKVAITAPTTSATLTIADGSTLATSGAFPTTITSTGTTSVTLPTSGTLATTGATVASFSAGTTGLTPATATTGAVTLGGKLDTAYGGTNSTATPKAGGLAYGTGTAYAFSAAGNVGDLLVSGGTVTPGWYAPSTLTIGTATNLAGGTANQVPYQSAAGVTTFITAPGTTAAEMSWSGTTFSWNPVTGSGSSVQATSPTLVTPNVGVATATSIAFTGSTSGSFTLNAAAVAGSGYGLQYAGNNTTQSNVALIATSGDTNTAIVLTPKGTGGLIAGPAPDGTATGGNARGANAIDLQTVRTAASQIAAGANSIVIGGTASTAHQYDIAIGYGAFAGGSSNPGTDYIAIGRLAGSQGAGSVAIGYNARSTGQYSIALGYNAYTGNYFNLQQAIAIGYNAAAGTSGNAGNNLAIGIAAKNNNTTNGNNSAAIGYQSWVDGQTGKIAFGTGSITTAGDSQTALTVLRASTASTAAKVLTADSAAAASTNVANIPQNAMFLTRVYVVGRETASGSTAGGGWVFDLLLARGTGSAAIVGSVTSTVIALSSGWASTATPVITADTTNNGLTVTVTPVNANATHWVANIQTTEVW